VAGEQFAHLLTDGHFAAGLIGFVIAVFAVCWCWINFSWFASAYDTDDWAFRVATMVQMVGVIVLALGLPPVFHSIDAGHTIEQRRNSRRLCGDAAVDDLPVATRCPPRSGTAGSRCCSRTPPWACSSPVPWSSCWSRWSVRSLPSVATAGHRGMPITSPSDMGC
jgi:hypothetical protein